MPELDHTVFCEQYLYKKNLGEQVSPICADPPRFDEYSRWHPYCKTKTEETTNKNDLINGKGKQTTSR